MPTPLSEIDAELRHTGPLNDIGVCLAAGTFLILRLLVSFVDCGRVMRDIVLGVLCGATVGLFVAMAGDFF
jgi:hypothetical protein